MNESSRWEKLGRDPYWAVCVDARYRKAALTDDDRKVFFESGDAEIARTFEVVRRLAGPGFRPRRSLDFGCGVGRLTFPIARESGSTVGVDISVKMLEEARRNCLARGVSNVELLETDVLLKDNRTTFDFLHSYIVFQHIPPSQGMAITESLLARLEPGGVGALHYTYGRRAGVLRRVVSYLRRVFPPVEIAVRVAKGQPAFEPTIPMHEYDLGQVLALLDRYACRRLTLWLTDHGGYLGCMLVFQREGTTAG